MLTVEDRLAISRFVGLYGHIIDERQFSRIEEIFAPDVVYDVSRRGAGRHHGTDAVRELWMNAGDRHPLAHHATNIVIDEHPDGKASILSKGVCVHADGRVHSTTYRQVATRTDAGWRISYLEAEMRDPSTIAQPS